MVMLQVGLKPPDCFKNYIFLYQLCHILCHQVLVTLAILQL